MANEAWRKEPRDERGRWTLEDEGRFRADMGHALKIGAISEDDYRDLAEYLDTPGYSGDDARRYHEELRGYIAEEERRQVPLPDAFKETSTGDIWKVPGWMGGWEDSLTPVEREAMQQWKSQSYPMFRHYLTTGEPDVPSYQSPEQARDWITKEVANADAAIAKAPLPVATKVYRGMAFDKLYGRPAPPEIADMKPGDIVTFPGYTASSTSEELARKYAGYGREGYFWEIVVPKGYPAAPTDIVTMDRIAGNESELTLPRNTKLKIHKIYRERTPRYNSDGLPMGPLGFHVYAEVVPPEATQGLAKGYNPNEPRDSRGRWTVDASGLSPSVAGALDEALTFAQSHYASMAGLQVGPLRDVVAPGESAPERQMMTTFSNGRTARAIGYDPEEMSSDAVLAASLKHQREIGHLTIPDGRGVAWHEAGHVVYHRNPAGRRVMHDTLRQIYDRMRAGEMDAQDLYDTVGHYGVRDQSELFAELYRLRHTSGLPPKLGFACAAFDELARVHDKEMRGIHEAQGDYPTLAAGEASTFRERLSALFSPLAGSAPKVRIDIERKRQSLLKERAAAVNPLLGEFSRLPMAPETERLRAGKAAPEVRKKYMEISEIFDRKLAQLA